MTTLLLVHGGLGEEGMGADRFWRQPGISARLEEHGFEVLAPDRQHHAPDWAAEASHLASALPDWARARATERLASRLAGGVLTVAASEQRSQLANRQGARARLAALLRDAVAPPQRPRVPTRPSRGANERRLEAKRQRSAVKRGRRLDRRDPE